LERIDERPVAPTPAALEALSRFAGPLPEAGEMPDAVLALLDEAGSPATVASAGGRYFGFVIGGSVPAALAANILAAAWDQNAALRVMSPVAAALEDVALAWCRELLGLPQDCAGSLVTCATVANFTCIAAARSALLAKQGWNVEDRGLFGAPPFRVLVGEECHISVRKGLSMAGLGRDRVEVIPADEQGRMRADAFPKLDAPALICIQAGNVNTGNFDPAGEICAIARESGSWVHVDGAFGLWAVCSPARRHLVEGFGCADSWATDGHKWLNVPYDCGLAFVRGAAAPRHEHAGVLSAARPAAGSDAMDTRNVAPRTRRGGMGRAEIAGTRRGSRSDRENLRICAALCGWSHYGRV
jgi:glutamate/tyrosine decarboxylase-like PLP-dependent enzyme